MANANAGDILNAFSRQKFSYFDWNFTDVILRGSFDSNGLGSGMVVNRWQAIT